MRSTVITGTPSLDASPPPADNLYGSPQARQWSIVFLVLALSFALRLYRVDFQTASGDEVFSLDVSRQPLAGLTIGWS